MTLTDILDQRERENRHTLAYVYRGQKITYEEIANDCRALAGALAGLGVKTGDRFAICVRNSPEFVITWFALAKLGAIAVHINFMTSDEETAYILKDSGAKGILTQKEFSTKLRRAAQAAGTSWIVLTDETPGQKNEKSFSDLRESGRGLPCPQFSPSPDTTVAILYTSGTTGKPKGAMLSHKNLASNAQSAIAHIGLVPRKEVILCILPMFHIFAWTAIVLVGFYLPCPVIIVESITPPKPWLDLMKKWKVTLFPAVPPIFHVLGKEAKGLKRLVLKYLFFRTVKYAISGAAPLPLQVLKTFEAKLGVPILEGYGLTETSPAISMNTVNHRKPGSVGTVIPNVDVIVIGEDGRILPVGEEGEICAKGPNVFQGYFNLPDATKETFTENGYLKTGDIGKLDEQGYLSICDRKKDMIIIKGLKVFPAQIEEIILRNDNVQEAAVVGIPQEDGDELIKAYVTPKKGATVNKLEIQELLHANLPPYKRPRDIEIRDELPKNALQKILKRELRREAIEKSKNQRLAAAVK
ncbi:MAG: AMP-binding protein [Elusimicrobiota bacterium]